MPLDSHPSVPPTHQQLAADPLTSAFVTANAGSGKTSTLVQRVARLLLHGAKPGAVLCVTYTKAAAAEMQRRLYETLGGWATASDETLRAALTDIGEVSDAVPPRRARQLFAEALETPGGLKIQTIHAFCEKLLRRFPLEAGVSPGFAVAEGAEAEALSADARIALAHEVLARPGSPVAASYEHFAVELAHNHFEELLRALEGKRERIAQLVATDGYEATCGGGAGSRTGGRWTRAWCGRRRRGRRRSTWRSGARLPRRSRAAGWRTTRARRAFARSSPPRRRARRTSRRLGPRCSPTRTSGGTARSHPRRW
jgi:ATP-dependent helicase/nuclease subunit A